MRTILLFLMLVIASTEVKPQDSQAGYFNPKCQARVIWDAVKEQRDIPELGYCKLIQLPHSTTWVPRYDPEAFKDYRPEDDVVVPVVTEADRQIYRRLLALNGLKPNW